MAALEDIRYRVVDLVSRLMPISSTSGEEYEIGIFLEQHLQELGYSVERIPIAPGSTRHNVYAYMGTQRQTRVLLTCHMDTVPPHIPLSIDTDGGVIRGRGACDDKGPLAAQIIAVEELRKENQVHEGDVGFLFVVGEEKGGAGMIAANDMNLKWEAVIFGEPTEGKLGKGHKGHVVFELAAHGEACHSGYPQLGSSAISKLVKALNQLEAVDWPSSELLGPSTFNIGKIEGGEGYNVVAAEAKALCSVRVANDLPRIKAQILDVVDNSSGVDVDIKFSYPEILLDFKLEGFDSAPVSFGTDAPRLKGSHKKILYGPGTILVAHGKDEHIVIDELMQSVDGYKRLVLNFL
ncbi:uncharacterized protein CTRU02_203204 [Colletotrichum truncatum]|uniref:Uncharacterized protein n=1 Tax=Colletotrichum truncatum TaxID=5467 RepID=A0ACC3Z8L3_COLTU|nr:uncharacterized protein CTRU02_09044 [Colletotrichum truncatum]KAF6789252.1 hypothetical protein CTRU02_09044 [Colletotrichum truncatum]